MSHKLWAVVAKIDLAIEMIKSPPSGETVEAMRSSVNTMNGQAENALNSVKELISRFIQEDESRATAAAAMAALPAPVPMALPAAKSNGSDDGSHLTEVEKLAERVFVSLMARNVSIENPAGASIEMAEGFFKKLAEREHIR